MSKQNEVAKKQSNELAVASSEMMAEMVQGSNVQSNDLLIPSLLLMQATSDIVTAEKAKSGDYVNSVTEETYGKSVEFQPFYYKPVFMVQKDIKGKDNFIGYEEVTSANINRPRRANHPEHGPVVYVYCMDFFGFVNGDTSLPLRCRFKNTSLSAGKAITTQMYGVNPKQGKLPHSTVFELTSDTKTNDEGTFKVTMVKQKREATADELKDGYEFWKIVRDTQVRVDDGATSSPKESTDSEEKTLY